MLIIKILHLPSLETKRAATGARIFRFRRSWRTSPTQPPPRVEFNEVPLSYAPRMIINIPQLILASAPRGRLCPSHKGTRDMFPTAFALTPHGQTGALAQQVQTRYLSIIIVADNGNALDASNYRKNETGIIQSQLRHVRSRGASLCAPPRYPVFFVFQKKAIREHESRGDRSLLIDVEILNAHRALVARRLVTFMTLSRSLNAARHKKSLSGGNRN